MNLEEFDIEDLLRSELKNEGQQAPSDVFDNILLEIKEKKRKRRFLILFLIGLGLVAGLAITYMALTNHFDTPIDKTDTSLNARTSRKQVPKREYAHSLTSYGDHKVLPPLVEDTIFHSATLKIEKPHSSLYRNTNSDDPFSAHSMTDQKHNTVKNIDTSNATLKLETPTTSEKNTTESQVNNLTQDYEQIDSESNGFLLTGDHNDSTASTIIGNRSDNSIETKEAKVPTTNSLNHPASLHLNEVKPENDTIKSLPPSPIKLLPTTLMYPDISESNSPEGPTKNSNGFALVLTAGPSLYGLHIFKPYFSSGALSNADFKSSGFELSIGGYKSFLNLFELNLTAQYNHKSTAFNYDLLISEEDYFELYQNDLPIPLENLDQPESCNCFLAEDVQLDYTVNTLKFGLGIGVKYVDTKKFQLVHQVGITSNLNTSFIPNSSQTVTFPEAFDSRFSVINYSMSVDVRYRIWKMFYIGLSPTYSYNVVRQNDLYGKSFNEIVVPINLRIGF